MKNQILAQAAEAVIYLVEEPKKYSSIKTSSGGWRGSEALVGGASKVGAKFIIKDRISKSYRIKILDDKIRKSRTKSETKLLEKAAKIINSPKPLHTANIYQIPMPFIDGKKLSEYLNDFPREKQKQICQKIGESVAKLHDANIIHGDLTTSNMILVENNFKKSKIPNLKKFSLMTNSQRSVMTKSNAKQSIASDNESIIFLFDFGLGFISHKLEDKAVDLHLLKQALEAKHFQNWNELFDAVIKGYSKYSEFQKVLERLKAVERRGRYKH